MFVGRRNHNRQVYAVFTSLVILITTYTAILTAGVVISQTWPPGLFLMNVGAILVSLVRPWRGQQSPEAEAWYTAHPELRRNQDDNFST